jgi:hypothetical protein
MIGSNPRPKSMIDSTGLQVAWSQDLRFLDPNRGDVEIARAHWYLTATHEPAGSGQPDPKDILIGSQNFRLWRKGDPPCSMCPFWERWRVHIINFFSKLRGA